MSTNVAGELNAILAAMKAFHLKAGAPDAFLRKDRLKRAVRMLLENHDRLARAMSDDFGNRSIYQSKVADIATTVKALNYSIERLETWMQPDHVNDPDVGVKAWIEHQPLGVVGIISPWNFPVNLAFSPLAGIFAAGNTALLKPSELIPHTSETVAELIASYFDPMELGVVLGDANVGAAFSGLPFDHLIFTGSTNVGRHVMRAAAENLVPVTLELGGKSPVVVASDADVKVAAERTLTVKTFNAGQICLSPDYVLIAQSKTDAFIAAAKALVAESFPSIQANPEYTSIVTDRHFERLVSLLDDAQQKGAAISKLGPENEPIYDRSTRKIAPVAVVGANDGMKIMQEEIFGPLLPIVTRNSDDDAIAYINAHPRPLAAYYFGQDMERANQFAQKTTSGALVVNDIMSHASIDTLPFGGVGAAGMGAYHGVHGFLRFSHAKPVVVQSESGASGLRLRAPYAEKLEALEGFFAK
ncbi:MULTISPECIES: coniferyl aldehyde dehydrogenase [unclassified Rhizobium]|uniref:coniferyl aldehyde dehydrogenase n=1 Tax=unclassified Rhizobium TaxID=2613769 RepID=UPI001FD7DC94|nr:MULTISPECIES: coniferyl aldehyde dehydrogenase [unclassified Rhizobium]